jgi:hypothetical protein
MHRRERNAACGLQGNFVQAHSRLQASTPIPIRRDGNHQLPATIIMRSLWNRLSCTIEEDAMTRKIFGVVCLLGLLVPSNVAWSAARWSRGDCYNAAHEKYGRSSADAGRPRTSAAIQRCLKYGPGAI